MAVQLKVMRMMHSDLIIQALEELRQENKVNATVNGSLPARGIADQIERTIGMTKSQISFCRQMMYPDVTLVAISDSDVAILEWAILEFMWTVRKNFSEGQHFRKNAEAMLTEWDEMEWKNGPVK